MLSTLLGNYMVEMAFLAVAAVIAASIFPRSRFAAAMLACVVSVYAADLALRQVEQIDPNLELALNTLGVGAMGVVTVMPVFMLLRRRRKQGQGEP